MLKVIELGTSIQQINKEQGISNTHRTALFFLIEVEEPSDGNWLFLVPC